MIKDLIRFVGKEFEDKQVRIASVQFKDLAMAKYLKASKKTNDKRQINSNKGCSTDFTLYRKFNFDSISQAIPCGGCGDGPEDWVDAFTRVNKLKWETKANTRKILVMITDQGGHGKDYHLQLNYEDEYINKANVGSFDERQQKKLDKEIQKIVKNEIEIIFLSTTKYSMKGYEALKRDYLANDGSAEHITVIENQLHDNDDDGNKLDQIKKDFKDRINKVIEETFMSTRDCVLMKDEVNREKIQKKKEEGLKLWQTVTSQDNQGQEVKTPKKSTAEGQKKLTVVKAKKWKAITTKTKK